MPEYKLKEMEPLPDGSPRCRWPIMDEEGVRVGEAWLVGHGRSWVAQLDTGRETASTVSAQAAVDYLAVGGSGYVPGEKGMWWQCRGCNRDEDDEIQGDKG
jgi:hypothetical protein